MLFQNGHFLPQFRIPLGHIGTFSGHLGFDFAQRLLRADPGGFRLRQQVRLEEFNQGDGFHFVFLWVHERFRDRGRW